MFRTVPISFGRPATMPVSLAVLVGHSHICQDIGQSLAS